MAGTSTRTDGVESVDVDDLSSYCVPYHYVYSYTGWQGMLSSCFLSLITCLPRNQIAYLKVIQYGTVSRRVHLAAKYGRMMKRDRSTVRLQILTMSAPYMLGKEGSCRCLCGKTVVTLEAHALERWWWWKEGHSGSVTSVICHVREAVEVEHNAQ